MPEGRSAPFKFLPKPGADLSVTFGKPVPAQEIRDTLASLVKENRIPEAPQSASGGLADPSRPLEELGSAKVVGRGWLSESTLGETSKYMISPNDSVEIARVRSAVTAIVQREVEALGREVVGVQSR